MKTIQLRQTCQFCKNNLYAVKIANNHYSIKCNTKDCVRPEEHRYDPMIDDELMQPIINTIEQKKKWTKPDIKKIKKSK